MVMVAMVEGLFYSRWLKAPPRTNGCLREGGVSSGSTAKDCEQDGVMNDMHE